MTKQNTDQEGRRNGYCCTVLRLLASRCDKLKMDSTNSKVIPEITVQRVIAIKPMAEIKWNHENEQKGNRCDNQKTNKKMADLNPTISIFTFNVNGLSI